MYRISINSGVWGRQDVSIPGWLIKVRVKRFAETSCVRKDKRLLVRPPRLTDLVKQCFSFLFGGFYF